MIAFVVANQMFLAHENELAGKGIIRFFAILNSSEKILIIKQLLKGLFTFNNGYLLQGSPDNMLITGCPTA